MSHTTDKIAVMQAFENGAQIERSRCDPVIQEWQDDEDPTWNWATYAYRVKERHHEWYFNLYTDGTRGSLWETREGAAQAVELQKVLARIVHVREVQ